MKIKTYYCFFNKGRTSELMYASGSFYQRKYKKNDWQEWYKINKKNFAKLVNYHKDTMAGNFFID